MVTSRWSAPSDLPSCRSVINSAVIALTDSSSGPDASIPYLANVSRNFGDLIVKAVPKRRTCWAPIRALSFAISSRMLMTGIRMLRTMASKR